MYRFFICLVLIIIVKRNSINLLEVVYYRDCDKELLNLGLKWLVKEVREKN